MAQDDETLRLTLMRVTIVEAANMVAPEGQPVRPYVTLRASCQLGQTRVSGGFKWSGLRDDHGGSSGSSRARARPGCAWRQSFDVVVRQQPASADLEDVLSLRLMSYQVSNLYPAVECTLSRASTCLRLTENVPPLLGYPEGCAAGQSRFSAGDLWGCLSRTRRR